MTAPPLPAYEGDDSFIFVSYSHGDVEPVYAKIKWLQDHGINVWYDEGIKPGGVWRTEIASAIERADLVVFFVSPRSVVSSHCLREIDFALDRARPILTADLERTDLPPAVSFRIGNVQAVPLFSRSEPDANDYLTQVVRTALDKSYRPGSPARPASHGVRKPIDFHLRTDGASDASNTATTLVERVVPVRWRGGPWVRSLTVGTLLGAVCAALLLLPAIRDLEQQLGLRWLFNIRGAIAPPEQVAIVVMNQEAASNISLPRDAEQFHRCANPSFGVVPAGYSTLPAIPARWPRCIHARLVDRLAAAGATAIVFDVLFRERPAAPGDPDLSAWQDDTLADALARSSRVVLAQKMELSRDGRETLSAISPAIASAAVETAPFPLAIDRGRVDRFPVFVGSEFLTPALPAIAFQVHSFAAYEELVAALTRHDPTLTDLLPGAGREMGSGRLRAAALLLRESFRSDPSLQVVTGSETAAADNLAALTPQARALAAMYAGGDTRYLNFYGPAGTIEWLGYDRALAVDDVELTARVRGRAVFVGYAESDQPEQTERFTTVFSADKTPDLSGVEIAATAFANLLNDTAIRQMPLQLSVLLVFLSALLTTVVYRHTPRWFAALLVGMGGVGYAVFAHVAFATSAVWVPFVVPLFVASPAAVLLSLVLMRSANS